MEWFGYLLKVTVCLGVFYTLYYLFLQKLTFFRLNRLYLLSTLLLSFLIPALEIPLQSGKPAPQVQSAEASGVTVTGLRLPAYAPINQAAPTPDVVRPSSLEEFDWQQGINVLYWIVAATILLVLIVQISILLWHSRKVIAVEGRLKIVQKVGRYTNCSFLHYIFVDQQKLDQATLAAVLHHERVHAMQYHSADKILLSICKALLWFSPPIYFYSQALEQTHEYEADQETSSRLGNTTYADLLLSLAVSTPNAPLVHSFVKNPVKKRIQMLFTNQSNNMKKLTYLSLIPAGVALLTMFSLKVVYAQGKVAIPVESLNLHAASNGKPLKITTNIPATLVSETPEPVKMIAEDVANPRLIDNVMLGEDPLVIIDGKKYTADILKKISPSCVKMSTISWDKAEITTLENKVTYATKAEIETAKTRIRAKANGKFFSKYPVTVFGHKNDEYLIRTDAASMAAAFPVGYRVMLSIDGKVYTEQEAKALPASTAFNITGLNYRYASDDAEVKSLYGSKCDVLIEVKKRAVEQGKEVKITRNAASQLGEDALGKLYFTAKDSTVVNDVTGVITLYGNATLENTKFNLSGDKIVFDKVTRTALAENVTFNMDGKTTQLPLAKFNLYTGTYEVLNQSPAQDPQEK